MLPDFLPDYGRGEVNLQYLLGFPNGEHWIVVPGVVGSNPISHPSTLASAGVFVRQGCAWGRLAQIFAPTRG